MGDQVINSSPSRLGIPVKSDGGGRLSEPPGSFSNRSSLPDLGFQFALALKKYLQADFFQPLGRWCRSSSVSRGRWHLVPEAHALSPLFSLLDDLGSACPVQSRRVPGSCLQRHSSLHGDFPTDTKVLNGHE